jgi:hypothetical protein
MKTVWKFQVLIYLFSQNTSSSKTTTEVSNDNSSCVIVCGFEKHLLRKFTVPVSATHVNTIYAFALKWLIIRSKNSIFSLKDYVAGSRSFLNHIMPE